MGRRRVGQLRDFVGPGGVMAGVLVAGALLVAACGSSGSGSSSGTTRPGHKTTTSTSAARSTTRSTPNGSSTTATTSSVPMVTADLPVTVCQTSSGVTTTTAALPGSVSVSVPASDAQQGNLAVYSDETGALMLIGPTVGWTCSGSFGADGSGIMALAPVGTTVPTSATSWQLPSSSSVQAIVAQESGASGAGGSALVCPLFSAARAATQLNVGKSCVSATAQEHPSQLSSVAVGFEDPAGVAGIGFPSGGQNPANGVALYLPKTTEPTAYLATCTLPSAQQGLCTAVLNHFVATFG
jgi:hypothetical protein